MEQVVSSSESAGVESGALTCVTCRVIFATASLQRDHYKSDWHRYNLKRKVADLTPVTADLFNKKVILQREEAAQKEESQGENRCSACRKSFCNAKSLENHLQSKKHRELELREEKTPEKKPEKPEELEDDMEVEEVDDEEWNEDEAIALESCLFCPTLSSSLDEKIAHMSLEHGFFVPDVEYCSDIEGLVLYLGEKVGCGHMCLWCNERGKAFRSLDAVQKHMRDKGHCKLWHEKDAMLEFADYFDYTSSYPEEAKEGEVDLTVLDSDNWELVLPSGAVIGHRALARYYRQNIKPERSLVVQSSSGKQTIKSCVLKQYKSLGWTGCTNPTQALQRAKDVQFWKRFEAKNRLRLGVKGNKLQRYFKRQDINL